MITALLCGLAFGALAVWERWAYAERERRRQSLLETLPPSDDEFDMEAWDKLSEEALDNFERRLGPALHDSETDGVPGILGTIGTLGTVGFVGALGIQVPDVTVNGLPLDVWLQQFGATSGGPPKRGM